MLERNTVRRSWGARLAGFVRNLLAPTNGGASSGAAIQREVVDLAWPIATAMLGDTAMGLVDTKLVGGLGAAALGGVGVGTTLMWLAYSIVFGLMRGVKVRAAYAVGEQRRNDATRYALAGVLMGAAIGAFVWALARDCRGVFHMLRIDASMVAPAQQFLAARTYGAASVAMLSALVQYRQGVGDVRTPMVVGITGNVINAVLAYGLIYGHFGLPALGVRGAGYGTATAETIEAVILLVLLVRDLRATTGQRVVSLRDAVREVFSLGGPTGLHFGLEMLAFTAFTAVLGTLGAREVAAHQIALAVIRTSFLPGVAVAEAASVLVGRSLGRRSLDEADHVTRTALVLAVTFMALCGLLFAFGGTQIAHAFTGEADVARIVRRLLLVAAVFQVMDATTIVLRGALRGAKDVRVVTIVGATVTWICVPGAAFLLGRVEGMGALGGWIGFVGETTLSACVFLWRWRRGGWRREYEPGPADANETVTEVAVSA